MTRTSRRASRARSWSAHGADTEGGPMDPVRPDRTGHAVTGGGVGAGLIVDDARAVVPGIDVPNRHCMRSDHLAMSDGGQSIGLAAFVVPREWTWTGPMKMLSAVALATGGTQRTMLRHTVRPRRHTRRLPAGATAIPATLTASWRAGSATRITSGRTEHRAARTEGFGWAANAALQNFRAAGR